MKINDIKTPYDILEFMKENIRYGWLDKEFNEHVENMQNFRRDYRTSSINNTLNHKLGTCIEQVFLMKQLFDKIGIECKMFCTRIYENNNPNMDEDEHMHCFILYYLNGKVYQLEHPNKEKIGIHEFETETQAIKEINDYYINLSGGYARPVTQFFNVEPRLTFNEFNSYINSLDDQVKNDYVFKKQQLNYSKIGVDIMKYPKVEFVPISLEKNIDIVKWAYFESDKSLDVYQYTIDYFKELKTIDDTWSKEKIYCFIEEIVTKHYNDNIKFINEEVKRYNTIWSTINDEYFKVLTKYLNINFPPSLKIINGFVGLLPICPRYLDTFDFCLSIGSNKNDIKIICAHETLHFLWYFKWLELYPNTTIRELDSPYLPWKYSEMVVDPIINSKEIKTVIDVLERAYESFYDIKDKNNKYMMDTLNGIYLKNISIEEKIKIGFEYVKKTLIFSEYLNQDINNPKYLFHGSPKKLNKITTHLSSDSSNNQNNIANAVFLFPSFLKATPYAFKDTIKENSDGLNWHFEIPNNNDYPLMIMSNVSINKNIIGYIYVFKKDDNMIKDEKSYQYKCYKDLTPIDVIRINYDDYKEFYKIEKDKI